MDTKRDIKFKLIPGFTSWINNYFLAVIIIGVISLICAPLSNTQSYHVVSFILLFVVSFMATFMELGPVLLASTVSALVWNYFFIPPHFTFHIDKTQDILMFGTFFIIALVNGVLTTRVRRQEQLAIEREERTNALFQLTKGLSKAVGIEEVLAVAIEDIKVYFSAESFFILQDGENVLHPTGRLRKEKQLTRKEYEIAELVFKSSKKAGKFTETEPSENYTFYPLSGTRVNPGVVAVKLDTAFTGDKKVLWDTFLAQIANALEREFLGELAQKARFLDESDKLYKTLFNSISHELRIPVATILGSADTLLSAPHAENIQSALYHEIFTASLRLNRLIENLLNMSRLESGRISVRLDWYDINDLVNKVTEDLEDELKEFKFSVSIPDNMPLVKIDFGLMEQVLYNLLFNSCEYAPDSTGINLDIYYENCELVIKISDMGPGFPVEALNNVFKKFYRVNGSKTGGLGLGLSIVKGFVEAHKGLITVENRKGGGAKFTIKIPSGNPKIDNLQLEKHE
jgi:two-component system sensor histidine kinase KdpD